MQYHAENTTDVLASFRVTKDGLSEQEVQDRERKYGKNTLPKTRIQLTAFKIFLHQWKSPLILILVVTGFVSGILKEYIDMTIILFTAFFNTCIGFVQEYKANNALAKLRAMVQYQAIAIRERNVIRISNEDIVKGDILLLENGNRIEADGRLIDASDLYVNEAVLTGESEPVKKHTRKLVARAPVSERANMVYSGTTVVQGRGIMVVTAIGAETEFGKIATLVQKTKDDVTPLQKQLGKLGKSVSLLVVVFASLLFFVGIIFQREEHTVFELFQTVVAVAVAAIPEGLVISLTVILSIGMQYILKRKALVRQLVAAETLGSVSVICVDKTGTLTEGNMEVTNVVTREHNLNFSELGLVREDDTRYADITLTLRAAFLCNDAAIENLSDTKEKWRVTGDTTETALLRAGLRVGFDFRVLSKEFLRVDDVSFSSERMFMATLHKYENTHIVFVKGAPEVLINRIAFVQENGRCRAIAAHERAFLKEQEHALTSQGFRVLIIAYKKDIDGNEIHEDDIHSLIFTGFIALSDPLRPDVKETLAIAKHAGIHVAMITGDHVCTAQSVAKELGMPHADGVILTGSHIDQLSFEQLRKRVMDVSIFARVTPEHKVRIVQAFQANGQEVAMTGDGVNDAPALKGADIGVALGSGTDVAKETSDMILLNDSFSTIVAAIEEGRTIYQNIKKVVLYLLSSSFAEGVMIGGSIVVGLPLPALPAQILWVNLVQEVFPTMALAFERGEKENMIDPPRKKKDSILDTQMKTIIAYKAILSNIALFCIFVYVWKSTGDIALTRTVVFVGFAIDALFYIFSIRSLRKMIWQIPFFNNIYLLLSVIGGWILLLSAVYLHPLQMLLQTISLPLTYWIIMVFFGIFNVVLIETVKRIFLVRKQEYIRSISS